MGDILEGRWLRVKGRMKRSWGALVGDADVEAEGSADVVTGAMQESVGIAKREAARGVRRGADRFAELAKKAARALER